MGHCFFVVTVHTAIDLASRRVSPPSPSIPPHLPLPFPPPSIYCSLHDVIVGMKSNGDGKVDRLCGLVVRVLGYRSGGPGSIPGTTRKNK
jgi:hypothetical protein